MTHIEAMKQALEALELARTCIEIDSIDIEAEQAADALRQAIATEESSATQEPVAVKRMLEWADGLKRLSDNGIHMNIPSELSAGTCWQIANDIEQFCKHCKCDGLAIHPQPKAEQYTEKELANAKAWGEETASMLNKAEQEPKREPMTDELLNAYHHWRDNRAAHGQYIDKVEAIKAAHGIKGDA